MGEGRKLEDRIEREERGGNEGSSATYQWG
jgi:hypothetical protein